MVYTNYIFHHELSTVLNSITTVTIVKLYFMVPILVSFIGHQLTYFFVWVQYYLMVANSRFLKKNVLFFIFGFPQKTLVVNSD